MTNWYTFEGRRFLDGTFHCCFATLKFLVDCETRVHHILSSRQQQIQLEAEKKRWFSPAEAWISVCHITEDIQAPVLHWAALPGQEMLFSRRSSTKELVNLVTSRIVPVALWRNQKGLKEAVLGAKFDQGTWALWSLQEQGQDVFLPFSSDCASCVRSPGLAAVFLWRFSLKISFKAFLEDTVTPGALGVVLPCSVQVRVPLVMSIHSSDSGEMGSCIFEYKPVSCAQ